MKQAEHSKVNFGKIYLTLSKSHKLLATNEIFLCKIQKIIFCAEKINNYTFLGAVGPPSEPICDEQMDFFDSNFTYMKTACSISLGFSYSDADAYCKANGMKLYSMNTADEYTELFKWLSTQFDHGSSSFLWIDIKFINGQWTTSNGEPFYGPMAPPLDFDKENCVSFFFSYPSFHFVGKSCTPLSHFPHTYCEFIDSTKVVTTSPCK